MIPGYTNECVCQLSVTMTKRPEKINIGKERFNCAPGLISFSPCHLAPLLRQHITEESAQCANLMVTMKQKTGKESEKGTWDKMCSSRAHPQ